MRKIRMFMEGAIPESVTRLIALHIRSLEQLEILLLLFTGALVIASFLLQQ